MRKAAYICAIVSTAITGILIIPLLWMIPMTIAIKNSQDDGKEHIALGVCSLFFMGILCIPIGILLLIAELNFNGPYTINIPK